MDWSHKILAICRYYRLSVSEFAARVGIPRGAAHTYTRTDSVKAPATPPIDIVPLIFKAFPEINVRWFLFDDGDMLMNSDEFETQHSSNIISKVQTINDSALQIKYTHVLEELNTVRKELIDCLKGHPDGLPPMRPSTKLHG